MSHSYNSWRAGGIWCTVCDASLARSPQTTSTGGHFLTLLDVLLPHIHWDPMTRLAIWWHTPALSFWRHNGTVESAGLTTIGYSASRQRLTCRYSGYPSPRYAGSNPGGPGVRSGFILHFVQRTRPHSRSLCTHLPTATYSPTLSTSNNGWQRPKRQPARPESCSSVCISWNRGKCNYPNAADTDTCV